MNTWLFAVLALSHKRGRSWRATLYGIANVLGTSTWPFEFPPLAEV